MASAVFLDGCFNPMFHDDSPGAPRRRGLEVGLLVCLRNDGPGCLMPEPILHLHGLYFFFRLH